MGRARVWSVFAALALCACGTTQEAAEGTAAADESEDASPTAVQDGEGMGTAPSDAVTPDEDSAQVNDTFDTATSSESDDNDADGTADSTANEDTTGEPGMGSEPDPLPDTRNPTGDVGDTRDAGAQVSPTLDAASSSTSDDTDDTAMPQVDAGVSEPLPPAGGCTPFSIPEPSEQALANTTSYRTPMGDGACRLELDYEGDGCVNGIYTQTVNVPGEWVTQEEDLDGNGQLDHRAEITYDPATRVMLFSMDENLDGVVDWTLRYFYDEASRIVRSEWDRGSDGALDGVQTWEFDGAGNLTRAATLDADGNPTVNLAVYEYDENGGRLTATITGAGQQDQFVAFENDDQGRPLLEQHYTGQATDPDLWIITSYDDAKRKTTEQQYYSEGSPTLTSVKTFDAQGRVILTELFDAAAELYESQHAVFDEAGNQHRSFIEANPAPTDDRRRSYACHH